ncbi:HD domain-containing protein [Enterobacter kobei]|uniref:HD domain-containing protein n=1 Tax=Enterobacter kobei TaxID=208224 RepID=UPI00316CB3D0
MKIENRLKQLAAENPNYSLLWAQWEFDKKLLSRALSTISRDFPHYSLHDSSHSSTIINQIEKVIEPNINKLSATDCWLLLESCYWHDAGMIITNEEKQALLKSDDFCHYLNELSCGTHELSQHAKEILEGKRENDISKALNISNSLTFIIADYFRVVHAERSGLSVIEPLRAKVNSPRTSLIPQRLFNFVSQIVECHGKSPEDILNLAKYNDGMDADDYAHPRYIAALLRIGDLLDIDDGRFCPTLLANIGDVPVSSLHHQKKHASIKHLLINSEVIEIKAECELYGSFHAQQAWFDYIRNEFDYQKRVWNEIVPDIEFRALPTIGELKCEIKGYIAIDGKVPKLTLNNKRIYDYITGTQIYSEKYPFVRELIQNAIDATVYKVWDDLLDMEGFKESSNEEKRATFNNSLNRYQININCFESESESEKVFNYFQVQDFGTGMTLNDIKKFLNVGSEAIPFRKKLTHSMPEWAKPSGYFGIGLQTVFTFCSHVTIKTKYFENPCYLIKIERKKNIDSYEISIQEMSDKKFKGTIVSAKFEKEKISNDTFNSWNIGFIKSYVDPLLGASNNIFEHCVNDTLFDDFNNCRIPLFVNEYDFYSNKGGGYKIHGGNKIEISDYDLGIDCNVYIDVWDSDLFTFKYKGVEFRTDSGNYQHGLSGEIDIFSNSAGYWLTIDRKKGRSDRVKDLTNIVNSFVRKHYNYLRENTEDQNEADFYIFAEVGITVDDQWKHFQINGIELNQYIYEQKQLKAFGEQYDYTGKSRVVDIDGLVMQLLSKIIIANKISVSVSLGDSSITNKNKRQGIIDYRIDFKSDNLGEFVCAENLLLLEFDIHQHARMGRQYFPCFEGCYLDISIEKEWLPVFIDSASPLNMFSNKFLFTPQGELDIGEIDVENELEIIYGYYVELNLTNLNEVEFKEKYRMLWERLKLI